MTRKEALRVIEADAAESETGQLSQTGLRAYIENRVGYQAMLDAVERGRRWRKFIQERDSHDRQAGKDECNRSRE